MWFVENDESDENDEIIFSPKVQHIADEIDEIEQIDERFLFDISEILFNELLMWVDENDELDDVHVILYAIDVIELLELIDVLWFAKLCNLFQ